MSLATLAVAGVLGGSLSSCSGDDELYVITDNNDGGWLVTSVAGIYCTYDEDNKLTSIIDEDEVYYVSDDGKLTITYNDSKESINAKISLNGDNNITKIEYSGIEYGDEKWEGTCDINYNSDKRLQSCTITDRGEELNSQNRSTSRFTASFTWVNDNLVSWTENRTNNQVYNGNETSNSWTETYTHTYGGQENPRKQFPYFMGKNITTYALDDDIAGVFSVLGLFGYGPKYLPTGCRHSYDSSSFTYDYTFSFILNSNGTLYSETLSEDSYKKTYNYVYTPTRAGNVGTQSLKELLRNSLRRRTSLGQMEQEQ